MAIANQQSGPNPSKEWELLCGVSELENMEATRIEIDDLKLSVSKIDESIYVVSDMCTHANYSLSDGPLHPENLTIECWKHGAQFCLSTGCSINPAGYKTSRYVSNRSTWRKRIHPSSKKGKQ